MKLWKKKKKGKNSRDDECKKLREVVDGIFSATGDDRKKMTSYLNQFNGKIWPDAKDEFWPDGQGNELKPWNTKGFINMIFSTVESIAPMLTDSAPIPHLIPKFPFLENLAKAYNYGLRYSWDVLDMQMVTYKAVLDAMIMRVGIFKLYYDEDKGPLGDICVENVDPREFFIAPGYTTIWDAPFCGERGLKPLSWIRANFPDVKDIKAEQGTGMDQEQLDAFKYGDAMDYELDARFATVYQVWWKDEECYQQEVAEEDEEGNKVVKHEKGEKKFPNGKFLYFTKDKFLGEMASPFEHGLPPYVELHDYVRPHNFLGLGEGDQIEGLNRELNLQFQRISDFTRQYHSPNYSIDVAALTEEGEHVKSTFHEGNQMYMYDSRINPQAIAPIEMPRLQPEVFQSFAILQKIIEEISGVTDVSKGVASKKERQSASEVAVLAESSHTRTRQRVRNLEWSLKRVAYLLVRLMMQYYTKPRSIHWREGGNVAFGQLGNSKAMAEETIMNPQVAGKVRDYEENPEGQMPEPGDMEQYKKEYEDYKQFIEFFGEDDPVYFDFDVEIQTNSTLPMDKQSLANVMLRLFQMAGVDRQATLETLQIPNAKEIAQRMEQAGAPVAPGLPPTQPQGGPPGGMPPGGMQ